MGPLMIWGGRGNRTKNNKFQRPFFGETIFYRRGPREKRIAPSIEKWDTSHFPSFKSPVTLTICEALHTLAHVWKNLSRTTLNLTCMLMYIDFILKGNLFNLWSISQESVCVWKASHPVHRNRGPKTIVHWKQLYKSLFSSDYFRFVPHANRGRSLNYVIHPQ